MLKKAVLYISLTFGLFNAGLSFGQVGCRKPPQKPQQGDQVTFYIFTYARGIYSNELRVSNIFEISYNMDSVVLNERIAFNLATEFEQYLMGIRQDESVTPNKVIRKAQDKGIVRCMNKGFVDKRRKEIVEAFERRSTKEFEMRVIEEKSFDFKYPFNQYYKGNTTVRIVAL